MVTTVVGAQDTVQYKKIEVDLAPEVGVHLTFDVPVKIHYVGIFGEVLGTEPDEYMKVFVYIRDPSDVVYACVYRRNIIPFSNITDIFIPSGWKLQIYNGSSTTHAKAVIIYSGVSIE